MGLKELQLRKSYESDASQNHLLDDFYTPVLQRTKKYFRIAGFFSSTALSVAVKGIEELIHNNGTMFLLISPTGRGKEAISISILVSLPRLVLFPDSIVFRCLNRTGLCSLPAGAILRHFRIHGLLYIRNGLAVQDMN